MATLRIGVSRIADAAILFYAIGGVPQMKRDGVWFDNDAVHMALDQVAVAGWCTGSIVSDWSEAISKGVDDQRLDLGRGHAGNAASLGVLFLQNGVRDIIAVADPILVRVGRRHPVAAIIKDAAGEKRPRPPQPDPPRGGAGRKLHLHGVDR